MLRRTWWKLALCAILTGLLAIGALAEPALTDETSQPADEQAVADALAEALYARASAEEPAVTADMQSMETEYAHLVGLDFRLKSRESIFGVLNFISALISLDLPPANLRKIALKCSPIRSKLHLPAFRNTP